jgi:hypothetical protein
MNKTVLWRHEKIRGFIPVRVSIKRRVGNLLFLLLAAAVGLLNENKNTEMKFSRIKNSNNSPFPHIFPRHLCQELWTDFVGGRFLCPMEQY